MCNLLVISGKYIANKKIPIFNILKSFCLFCFFGCFKKNDFYVLFRNFRNTCKDVLLLMSVFCVLPHFNVRNDVLSVLFDLHVHAVIKI